jgi:NADPH:quinone reductase-like Zn-dependent oxidoreductase
MKALTATGYGDVDRLTIADVPEPRVGPRDVKVKVHAASINPIDWKLLAGHARMLMELSFPAILGRDASGEVQEVGADVKALRPGDHVLGWVSNAFAEYVVAPADDWVNLPPGLDLTSAAALPLVTLTGAQLADAVHSGPGMTVLVTGALGAVGRSAVFVAKTAGASVWAGVRQRQKDAAAALGVAGVTAIDDVGEIGNLPPLDAICDTVGGAVVAALLPRLKAGGVVASVLGAPAGAKERGLKAIGLQTQPDSRRLATLAQAASEKRLVIPVDRTFPLAQGAEAFQVARSSGVGKVILLP